MHLPHGCSHACVHGLLPCPNVPPPPLRFAPACTSRTLLHQWPAYRKALGNRVGVGPQRPCVTDCPCRHSAWGQQPTAWRRCCCVLRHAGGLAPAWITCVASSCGDVRQRCRVNEAKMQVWAHTATGPSAAFLRAAAAWLLCLHGLSSKTSSRCDAKLARIERRVACMARGVLRHRGDALIGTHAFQRPPISLQALHAEGAGLQ